MTFCLLGTFRPIQIRIQKNVDPGLGGFHNLKESFDKKSMEPVFAIKITPEMLEPYKTHKAQGGLVEHIDIFEV